MPFITQFNASRITRQVKEGEFDLEAPLFTRPIYFFSKFERQELMAFRSFIKDPDFFITHIYTPIDTGDRGEFIFEYAGQQPSYHMVPTCSLMHRDFENIRLSEELKKKLASEGVQLKAFRRWAYDNLLSLFRNRAYDQIIRRIEYRWGVTVNQGDIVQFDNSDVVSLENLALDELEHKIDQLISAAGRYFFQHEHILRRFSKLSFLHVKATPIEGNETGLSDAALKTFLRDYHMKFKRPAQQMLRQWYMVSFNPEMKFKGNLLEQLNFKVCSSCQDAFLPAAEDRKLHAPPTPQAPPPVRPFAPVPPTLSDDLPF